MAEQKAIFAQTFDDAADSRDSLQLRCTFVDSADARIAINFGNVVFFGITRATENLE